MCEIVIEFIEKIFNIWSKSNWLRCINKEVNKYYKLKEKTVRQHYILKAMVKRYEEIYGENFEKLESEK